MGGPLRGYAGAEMDTKSATGIPGNYNPPTVRQRLQSQLIAAEENVANLKAAIEQMDRNPGVENLLTALGKVGI